MNKISIIGLGYVGLPLALVLSKKFNVFGFDLNIDRVNQLKKNVDINKQFSPVKIKSFKKIFFTNNKKDIENSSAYIITVPTPVKRNKPDLSNLKKATLLVASYLKKNSIVIYESTVYPGVTENFCCKILERVSGLKYKEDFHLAYSPERINPGDHKKTIGKITKLIGASDQKTLKKVSKIYASFLGNNIHLTSNIKIAEAAKVIENSQRDINIAFMNELREIFTKANINIFEVLEAAKTKWNFLNFEPGLVGGHCIGVDPFYLAEFAKKNKVSPKIILSGRYTNERALDLLYFNILKKINKIKIPKVIILGCTFKENCPDIRNSKIVQLINKLSKKKVQVSVYDPWVNLFDRDNIQATFLDIFPQKKVANLILIAVKHNIFYDLSINQIKNISSIKKTPIIDYKNIYKL
jgi:UDP-N-acetyl-D-galactosamine dehydrogenase